MRWTTAHWGSDGINNTAGSVYDIDKMCTTITQITASYYVVHDCSTLVCVHSCMCIEALCGVGFVGFGAGSGNGSYGK